MHVGADTKRNQGLAGFGPAGLSCLAIALFACGGRTLDDGVYSYSDTSSPRSCAYQGREYADGSAIPEPCFCFCNNGQIECDPGCSGSSGGASSGGGTTIGTAGDGAATSSGGVSTAGGSTAAGSSNIGGDLSVGGSISTAGSFGTGGASTGGASTGGATFICGEPTRSLGTTMLIDNMEDGDANILPVDGRSGVWFTYNEGSFSGYQFPNSGTDFTMLNVPRDATGGVYVANTFGKGFSTWGAGMGFVLNNGCPYDASLRNGVHFFVRSELGPAQLYVLLPTAATTPTDNHGTCIPATTSSCYDDYQVVLNLDGTWQEEYVSYAQLQQLGWGTPAKFDPSTLMGVNFQTVYGGGESFSFSVDSISFY